MRYASGVFIGLSQAEKIIGQREREHEQQHLPQQGLSWRVQIIGQSNNLFTFRFGVYFTLDITIYHRVVLMPEYKVDLSAFWGTTSPKLIAEMPPRALYEHFGYPLLNDGDGESMGTYVFVSDAGSVVTIYYRANDIWQLLLRLLKKSFWRTKETCRLTIGANSKPEAQEFARWLVSVIPCSIGNWPW